MDSEDETDRDWGEAWDKDLDRDDVDFCAPSLTNNKQPSLYPGNINQNFAASSRRIEFGPKPSQTAKPEPSDVSSVSQPALQEQSLMSRMKLNDNKAGMEGIDREKINQIIYEASKGSRYFDNEKKKEEQVNKRIAEQMAKIPRLTDTAIQHGVMEADKLLSELEAGRNLSRSIVHVDMDAFYAAVEMRDNPRLRNVPMAVGDNSMLCTSNYLARRFGVRAAMPGFIAKKLCPNLVLVPTSFDKYQAVSKDIRAILSEYDPNMCPMSLDEAYLDMTDHAENRPSLSTQDRTYSRLLTDLEVCSCEENTANGKCGSTEEKDKLSATENQATCDEFQKNSSVLDSRDLSHCVESTIENVNSDQNPDVPVPGTQDVRCVSCNKAKVKVTEVMTFGVSVEEAVREMRFRIHQKTQLTASAGIAPNIMLAKVCSDKNKPNGQYVIPGCRQAVLDFIQDLPIRKVSGIGKVTEKMLSAVGVVTCPDLYTHRGLLYHLYSPISFNYFMRICAGIGSTTVERDGERKSISVERTFSEINKPAELYKKCYELSEALAEDLKAEQMMGKTVTLKLKLSNFEVRTRANTVMAHIGEKDAIYSAARDILRLEIQAAAPHPLRLRLMGVRMSNLINQQDATDPKQGTITGLFKKIQTKTQSNSPNTSPIKRSKTSPKKQSPRVENHNSASSHMLGLIERTAENDSAISAASTQFPPVVNTESSTISATAVHAEFLSVEGVKAIGDSESTNNNFDCSCVMPVKNKGAELDQTVNKINFESVESNCDEVHKVTLKNMTMIDDFANMHDLTPKSFGKNVKVDRNCLEPEATNVCIDKFQAISKLSRDENRNVHVEPELSCLKEVSYFGFISHLTSDSLGLRTDSVLVDSMIVKSVEVGKRQTQHEHHKDEVILEQLNKNKVTPNSSLNISHSQPQPKSADSYHPDVSAEEFPNTGNLIPTEIKLELPSSLLIKQDELDTSTCDEKYCKSEQNFQKATQSHINDPPICMVNEVGQYKTRSQETNSQDRRKFQNEPNDLDEGHMYECPICFKNSKFTDLSSFTSHIDQCLAIKCAADDDETSKFKNSSTLKGSNRSISSRDLTKVTSPFRKMTKSKSSSTVTMPEVAMATSGVVKVPAGVAMDVPVVAKEVPNPCSSKDTADILVCPICNAPQRRTDLALFNQHVDSCLNRETIREMIRQPVKSTSNNKRKSIETGNDGNTHKKQKTDQKTKGTLLGFFTKNS